MAYDEPTFRRHGGDSADGDPAAYRTNGFTTADYRGRRRDQLSYDPSPYEPPGRGRAADESGAPLLAAVPDGERTTGSVAARGDDRGARDSGNDRLGIHFAWEVVLLLAVAAIGYLLYRLDPASLKRPALDALLLSGAAIGLLTLGAGLTLRAGVPNLAVGPVAIASAVHFAENGDLGVLKAAVPAVVIAAVGGLAVALVVVAFHVPGWTATLAGAMGVIVFIQLRPGPVEVQGAFDPSNRALVLFGGFALLAMLGGGLGTVPTIRRTLGRLRPVGDPADRRGALAALPVIGALTVSSALAVVAGVLLAANSTTPIAPGTGLEWTGIAIGLALVAGTSAFGRRGGVFGTLFAVTGMTLFLDYADRRDYGIALFAIAASTVAAGLVVTRLIETYGRLLPQPGDDWQSSAAGENWSPDLPETWSPAVPAPATSDRWLDDRWGQSPR
jgi:hypothetical protein